MLNMKKLTGVSIVYFLIVLAFWLFVICFSSCDTARAEDDDEWAIKKGDRVIDTRGRTGTVVDIKESDVFSPIESTTEAGVMWDDKPTKVEWKRTSCLIQYVE